MSTTDTERLAVPRFTLTIEGTEYEVEHAVCEDFRIGPEDHGLFTADIRFAGPTWGQGLPARALDTWDEDQGRRVGTAFGMDFIMQAVRILGSPEQAKGVRVVVFRKSYGSFIEGFARLADDGAIDVPFFPAALAERHYPSEVPA